MKRNLSPSMDTVKPEPGQSSRKRLKSESPENSGIEPQSKDDSLSRKVKKCIAKFFYESGLDFDAVNLPSFQRMISLCSEESEFSIPTAVELKGVMFEDAVKEMHDYVQEIKTSWADTGCSVLLDGWTDEEGRNLMNVLVDCPKGTVYLHSADISEFVGNMNAMLLFLEDILSEIGVKNVVQIVTNSTSALLKNVGKLLTEKYRPIFWTVSASCCVEFMLEKLGEIDFIEEILDKAKLITEFIYGHPEVLKIVQEKNNGQDLVKPSKIRRIIPFLTLENIVLQKEILKTVFLSPDSKSSFLTSTAEEKRVAKILMDRLFWGVASTVLTAAIPLVNVIKWIDCSKEPHMGLIYETIDQAKETIKEGFKHNELRYMPYWKVIDDVWNEHLYSPIHSAGYFLNPSLFYSSEAFIDPEVATGLLCCIVRSTKDLHVQDLITMQMEQYRMAKGDFGAGWAPDKRSENSPALWWSVYGGHCPELQRLAIRVLSQTCDGASKFQLKRSLAEKLLRRGRNQMEQKKLTDMVFLRYNMQLQNFSSGKTDYLMPSEVDPTGDWLVDNAQNRVSVDR